MFHRTLTKIILASFVGLATLENAPATPNAQKERVERGAPSRKRILEVAQATDGPPNEDLTRLVFPPLEKRRRVGNASKDLSVAQPTAALRQHTSQNADILPSERPENRPTVAAYYARIGLSQPPLVALAPEPLLPPRHIERAPRGSSALLARARNTSPHASASSSPGSLSGLLEGMTLNTPPVSPY